MKPLLLALLLLIAGCSLHEPVPVQPPGGMPETIIPEAVRSEPSFPDPWWAVFEDPELSSIMEGTFSSNLELVQAYARLKQLQAVSEQTDSDLWPTLDLRGEGGRSRQAGFPEPVVDESFSLSAAAAYEIDIWRRLSNRVSAADLDVLASGQELAALYLSLSAQVADLYFVALEQRALIELTRQTVASFAETLDRVELRYRKGLVPALDVYQSRENLAAARARLPEFKSLLAQAENGLAVLMGKYPHAYDTDPNLTIPSIPMQLPDVLPGDLLLRRPDVRASLLRIRASDHRVAAAIADRFPSIALTGRYGGASAEISEILSSPNIFWNLLLNLAMPILDGGRRAAEVDRARAVVEEQLAAYHQSVLTAFQEVQDGLVSFDSTRERIGSLEQRAEASGASLRLAKERYLQGLSDYLPVLTAQSLHFDAQRTLLSARRQLATDFITLVRALGGTWMDAIISKRHAYAEKRSSHE